MFFIAHILLMTGGDAKGGGMGQLIMIPLIFVVFYFFMLRPQMKKTKDAQKFKDSVKEGDKIVTIGGIHARIKEIRATTFLIEAGTGLKFEIEKSAVNMELTKALQTPPAPNK